MITRCSIVLAAAIIAAFALGCGGKTEVWKPPSRSPADAATTWVIVVDLSKSTVRYRGDFATTLEEVLKHVQPGDRVVVLSVEETAVKDSRYLFEEEVAQFQFSSSPQPETDNELYIDAYNAGESARYSKEFKEWESVNDPAALKERVFSAVEQPLLKKESSPSDLFGALYLAGNALSTSPGKKRLVFLTDGLVNYAGVNWQHIVVTGDDVKAVLKQQRDEGSIPDLSGSSIAMIGTSADDAEKYAALRKAWMDYTKAVGGSLSEQDFQRQLELFQLQEWLK